jgi:hypothetical protein
MAEENINNLKDKLSLVKHFVYKANQEINEGFKLICDQVNEYEGRLSYTLSQQEKQDFLEKQINSFWQYKESITMEFAVFQGEYPVCALKKVLLQRDKQLKLNILFLFDDGDKWQFTDIEQEKQIEILDKLIKFCEFYEKTHLSSSV